MWVSRGYRVYLRSQAGYCGARSNVRGRWLPLIGNGATMTLRSAGLAVWAGAGMDSVVYGLGLQGPAGEVAWCGRQGRAF